MRADDAIMINQQPTQGDVIRRLVIDIETGQAAPELLDLEREMCKAAGNIKDPEKKEKNLADKQAAIDSKDGKLDVNPIACIGVEADGELWHFSTFDFSSDEFAKLSKNGIKAKTAASESEMLKSFRKFCDTKCGDETAVIAWNGKGFDSRRIRFAYARNGIAHPEIFKPYCRNWHVDLMYEFGDKFTVNDSLKKMSRLDQACKYFGVEYHKGLTGAEIPAAVTARRFFEVTRCNIADVLETSEVGRLMGF